MLVLGRVRKGEPKHDIDLTGALGLPGAGLARGSGAITCGRP